MNMSRRLQLAARYVAFAVTGVVAGVSTCTADVSLPAGTVLVSPDGVFVDFLGIVVDVDPAEVFVDIPGIEVGVHY
jgi:hypothetical protein